MIRSALAAPSPFAPRALSSSETCSSQSLLNRSRPLAGLALALCGALVGAGCNDGGTAAGTSGPTGPPLVTGLSISEVAVFQSLKGALMKDGTAASSKVPIIAGRPGLLRVYVAPQAGWVAHEILARVELTQAGKALPALEWKQTIASASTDGNLTSTINFDLPKETLTPDLTWSVSLYEVDAAKAVAGQPTGARYPATGQAAFGAVTSGKIKVTLLPVVYQADGSNRMPVMGADVIEKYRVRMMNLYPASEVDISVGQPFSWPGAILADGSGWDRLLNAIVEQRQRDGVDSDVYYYGVFNPATSFNSYCRQGCVLGLSPVAYQPSDGYARASIGVGYNNSDAGADATFVHEVGHAHGREHAPCMTQDADPDFPYSDGEIGSWGYDAARKRLIDPAGSARDMMGYCDPVWISDYTYSALYERVKALNTALYFHEVPTRWRSILVGADGLATRGGIVTAKRAPVGREKQIERVVGGSSELVSARFYPFDHLPGGILLVPEEDDTGTLHVDGQLVR